MCAGVRADVGADVDAGVDAGVHVVGWGLCVVVGEDGVGLPETNHAGVIVQRKCRAA